MNSLGVRKSSLAFSTYDVAISAQRYRQRSIPMQVRSRSEFVLPIFCTSWGSRPFAERPDSRDGVNVDIVRSRISISHRTVDAMIPVEHS